MSWHSLSRQETESIRESRIIGNKTLLLIGYYGDDLRIVTPFQAKGRILVDAGRLDCLTWSINNSAAVLRLKKGSESRFVNVPDRLRGFVGMLEGVPLLVVD